ALAREVLQDSRIEVPELAACLGAVRLPPIVSEFRKGDGIERARREVLAHCHFGLAFREDAFGDLGRSLLRALANVCTALILVPDGREPLAEVHAPGSGSGGHRARTVRCRSQRSNWFLENRIPDQRPRCGSRIYGTRPSRVQRSSVLADTLRTCAASRYVRICSSVPA